MGQDVAISKHIVKRLGEPAVEEVMASLFPQDCQTCNAPLAGETISLTATIAGPLAYANLHHRRCRKSQLQDGGGALPGGETLSYRVRSTLLPWQAPDGAVVQQPMFILNPGLESVFLEQAADGRWRVSLERRFLTGGMAAGAAGLTMQPVRGISVRLPVGGVAITMEEMFVMTYECGADEAFRRQARDRGGVLFVVTHALNPAADGTNQELLDIIGDHRTAAGWVGLARTDTGTSAAPGRPASNPAAAGVTYVLHWSPRNLTVGPLLAYNTAALSPSAAQQWAESVISCPTLIDWSPTINGEPASGWFTIDAISMKHYLLRQYPDGWRLVRSLSRIDGKTPVETDNEARAWAAGVLRAKAQVSGLTWAPGPSPDGANTLYGTA